MEINNLHVDLHMPDAPTGDIVHGLPPHCLQEAYKVDDYPACPVTWKHGSGKASSYFVAIEPGKHLWLDFNRNWQHPHHVAIVCSVQGLNPVTGQFIEELKLQQYRINCPIHNEPFGADRFCQKCHETDGMPSKWPPQNYMTTVSHLHGALWIDGWYADESIINGFLVTEETMRGIAAQVEQLEQNKDKERVFAIGIAFYLSKEPKPQPKPIIRARKSFSGISGSSAGHKYKFHSGGSKGITFPSISGSWNASSSPSSSPSSSRIYACSMQSLVSHDTHLDSVEEFEAADVDQIADTEISKLEIAGGAKISQQLCWNDPSEPSFYKDEPEGLIYINYCLKTDRDRIIAAGKKTIVGGFTAKIKTGNP